jgi:hypothetical protein
MGKMIFVNLPVTGLKRSVAFHQAVGAPTRLMISTAIRVHEDFVRSYIAPCAAIHEGDERP